LQNGIIRKNLISKRNPEKINFKRNPEKINFKTENPEKFNFKTESGKNKFQNGKIRKN